MTPRRVLFATACVAISGLFSFGCTGVLDPGGNGGGPGGNVDGGPPPDVNPNLTPQALFNATVRDQLGTKCIPCHVDGTGTNQPYFLASTADQYYTFLMADYPNEWVGTTPQASIIYTKGLEPHAGTIQWNDAEQGYLSDWIVAEYEDYSGGGGGIEPTPDPDAINCQGDPSQCALENFAKCFKYANWQTYQIGGIGNLQSATGACSLCHANGESGFYANAESLQTYTRWKELGYIGALVKGAADGQGNFLGLVPSNAIADKATDPGHPMYDMTDFGPNLESFVNQTLTDFGAAPCIDDPGN